MSAAHLLWLLLKGRCPDCLALIAKGASVQKSHGTVANRDTFCNRLSPQGSAHRQQAKSPISQSSERSTSAYFKSCCLKVSLQFITCVGAGCSLPQIPGKPVGNCSCLLPLADSSKTKSSVCLWNELVSTPQIPTFCSSHPRDRPLDHLALTVNGTCIHKLGLQQTPPPKHNFLMDAEAHLHKTILLKLGEVVV